MTDKKYSNYPVAQNLSVVIATSTTVSSEADLGAKRLVGIHIPSTFDGTQITFQTATSSGGTYNQIITSAAGAALTFTVAASKYVALSDAEAAYFAGVKFLKIVTSTAQTTTDTVFTLVTVPR
jgi:hypothetical protein